MTDAAPREGWYWATHDKTGVGIAIEIVNPDVHADWPGWTIIAHLDDLLRDAAILRYLRSIADGPLDMSGPANEAAAVLQAAIEMAESLTEIAREKGRADG